MNEKLKYTPGPWEVERVNDQTGFKSIGIKSESGVFVANIVFQPTDNETANARLIAAAPELLEALRAVLTIPFMWDDAVEILVKTALAKAEGA